MAFDKSLPNTGPFDDPSMNEDSVFVPEEGMEVELGDEGGTEELEDGSVMVDLEPAGQAKPDVAFEGNLAEALDDSDLNKIANLIQDKVEIDLRSRRDWEETCKAGLDMLGFKYEQREKPFKGACGISHPVLAEAVVRFQSQALTESFPAGGPARTKVVGKQTPEISAQAVRVEAYMNHLLTEEMEDYRDEHDRLLFCLPLFGSAFKKVYQSPVTNRPEAIFIEPNDLIVPYGATNLSKATRITHRFKKEKVWIQKMQEVGFYRSCELGSGTVSVDTLNDRKDEVAGIQDPGADGDLFTLYECHIYLALEAMLEGEEPGADDPELPYVVTLDKDSNTILAIRRNWEEDDPTSTRIEHFSDYKYVPGVGFYGYGLAHLIGGLTQGATSILRQLVDAGTFANLPGGFKSKDLKVTGDKTPIAPGEFRDVDLGITAKIGDAVMSLPYKEPSSTLLQLMDRVIEEARRFASLTDMNISNVNQEAPVGTTLALIERNMKVMTAIQSRLHASMKREFKILARLVRDFGPESYPFEVEDPNAQVRADFDDRVDVIPVSDPNSSTQAQRIMQAQAAIQIAQIGSPDGINMKKLKRYAMDVMGVPDAKEILPLDEDIKPMDPVSENMSLMALSPVKAFQYQDHDAHIQVHMLALQDPQAQSILEMAPQAQAIAAAMMSHVTEHLAMKYRSEMERHLGVALPPTGTELPEDVEVQLSQLTAKAADKLFRENKRAAEAKMMEEQMNDPVVQARLIELDLKKAKVASDAEDKDRRFQLDVLKELRQGEQKEKEMDQRYEVDTARVRIQAIAEVLFGLSQAEAISSQEKVKMIEMVMKLSDKGQAEARKRAESDDK